MRFVTKADYLNDYKIKVLFDTNESYIIDLKGELDGEIFEPLKQVTFFKKFFIHDDFKVITWPNGADFSSDFLYEIGKSQNIGDKSHTKKSRSG